MKNIVYNPTINKYTYINLSNILIVKGGNNIGSNGVKYLIKMELPIIKTMLLSK